MKFSALPYKFKYYSIKILSGISHTVIRFVSIVLNLSFAMWWVQMGRLLKPKYARGTLKYAFLGAI
jgi:hypothetical protein